MHFSHDAELQFPLSVSVRLCLSALLYMYLLLIFFALYLFLSLSIPSLHTTGTFCTIQKTHCFLFSLRSPPLFFFSFICLGPRRAPIASSFPQFPRLFPPSLPLPCVWWAHIEHPLLNIRGACVFRAVGWCYRAPASQQETYILTTRNIRQR